MLLLAIVTTVVSLMAIPLYSNTFVRYLFIAIGIVVASIIVRRLLKSEMLKK